MVTKHKPSQKRGKAKVGKLKLSKETIKDLSASEGKKVKGGLVVTVHYLCVPVQTVACVTVLGPSCYTCARGCVVK